MPESSRGAIERPTLVSTVRLGDIGWLFFGSTLVEILAFGLVSLVHGSRFISVEAALAVGNFWYLARYAWLSPRRGWVDLRKRFAPVDHRVLMGCVAGGMGLVFGFVGLKVLLEWGGIRLADEPIPVFAPSHLDQLPVALISIVIIGLLAEELLFRGLLLDWLRRWMRTWGAVGIVSILFSLAHGIVINYGIAGWLQCGYRVLMGIIAAVLTVRFRSLRPSLVFHATINFIGVAGTVVEGTG